MLPIHTSKKQLVLRLLNPYSLFAVAGTLAKITWDLLSSQGLKVGHWSILLAIICSEVTRTSPAEIGDQFY